MVAIVLKFLSRTTDQNNLKNLKLFWIGTCFHVYKEEKFRIRVLDTSAYKSMLGLYHRGLDAGRAPDTAQAPFDYLQV